MALEPKHVIRVTDHQRLLGRECVNIYDFQVPDGGSSWTLDNVITDFRDRYIPQIARLQVSDLEHWKITAVDLFDESKKKEELISIFGNMLNAETSSPFVALGMVGSSDDARIKVPQKRFAGIAESQINKGTLNTGTGGIVAIANSPVAQTLIGGLGNGTGVTFTQFLKPVVIKMIRKGLDVASGYRLPENVTELIAGTITDFACNLLATSQTSRKD